MDNIEQGIVEQDGTVFANYSQKARLFSRLLQLVVLLAGSALSLAAFLSLKVIITDTVKSNDARVMKQAELSIRERLSVMEHTIANMAVAISLSGEENHALTASRVKALEGDFMPFRQILWVYQTSPGRWGFSRLYEEDGVLQGADIYRLVVDQEVLKRFVSGGFFADESPKLVMNLPGMRIEQGGGTTTSVSRPLALVQTVKAGDMRKGLLVALTSSSRMFMFSAPEVRERLSMIDVYGLEDGRSIYRALWDRPVPLIGQGQTLTQSYNLRFAGSEWEIKAGFSESRYAGLVALSSYAALTLGLIVTVILTLYLRMHNNQSLRVMELNDVLERNNKKLRKEISKRTALNSALQKAEKENRAIIDSVSDIIFEADTSAKILFLSATWQKVTGFDVEQSKGLELFQMICPSDLEQQRKNFEQLVSGQKESSRTFTKLRTSDGKFRAVELTLSKIRLDTDDSIRVVGTFTDVEERRRAERALAETERKYRTIVENAAGGIYQLTPEGLYLSANPAMARILGYHSPEEILRSVKNANCEVYGDIRTREKFIRRLEEEGSVTNNEIKVRRKDGSEVWVNENAHVVRDESGVVLYYEGSLEDITSRKKTDTVLREAKIRSDLANRAKSEFLANMSHELRTPLNAIIGFSEMIKNEVFGPVGQKAYWEYARDINDSGQKLLTVINEILDISKIEAGERQLNESVVDVRAVVGRCLELLDDKIKGNKMSVTNTLHNLPGIIGEELAIKQIVTNLLSNAVKFTPSGGRITISSEMDEKGRFHLSFTDTGIGLDEKEVEKALSPFGQVNSELDRSGSGTGLGLTLVDALLKLHGGEMELFSQKGIGTTVTIIFPADRVNIRISGRKNGSPGTGETQDFSVRANADKATDPQS
ncbi:MAG: PAS domain-containing sensor histidine kinase [Alphaproteobacteria bacterium]|nr:PAS domain-containing sensor histidine kinase [Alphaproteobacteria bacterium]